LRLLYHNDASTTTKDGAEQAAYRLADLFQRLRRIGQSAGGGSPSSRLWACDANLPEDCGDGRPGCYTSTVPRRTLLGTEHETEQGKQRARKVVGGESAKDHEWDSPAQRVLSRAFAHGQSRVANRPTGLGGSRLLLSTCRTLYDTTCGMCHRHVVAKRQILNIINTLIEQAGRPFRPDICSLSHMRLRSPGSWCPPGFAPHYVLYRAVDVVASLGHLLVLTSIDQQIKA
jgi:hypothetical protein